MNLDQILDQIHPLPLSSKERLKEFIKAVEFPKGHILLQADKVERKIYFISKGIVRAYSNTIDNEITFWFGKEGDTVISMRSYVDNEKGYETIALLEDSKLFELQTKNLHQLYAQDLAVANWGRRFAEKELIKTEERLISRQFKTATERYQELLIHYPELIQRVSLGHIASYLGITQVSLSRIRADIK